MPGTWAYLIATIADAPPALHSNTVTDLEIPHLGIFCPHDEGPWLVGTFRISGAVMEQKNELFWTWDGVYLTGAGDVLRLPDRQGPWRQTILDNAPHDPEALRREHLANTQRMMATPQEKWAEAELERYESTGHFLTPEQRDLMEREDYANGQMRARYVLKCPMCQPAVQHVFRSDRCQRVVSTFVTTGWREIPLAVLWDAYNRVSQTD